MQRALLIAAMAVTTPASAGCGEKSQPIQKWHTSYLVVSNVGYSWIYAMSPNGTFKLYRPSRVDANEEPCTHLEKKDGVWCVADGRLYQAGSEIVAKSRNGMDGQFYLAHDGRVCAAPSEEDGFEGQCEDDGYKEAMSLFATYPPSR